MPSINEVNSLQDIRFRIVLKPLPENFKTLINKKMKKLLFSFLAASLLLNVNAQCDKIFISEYIEGSSNNKALEIYNPTLNAINLNNEYRLVRYNNGTSSAAGEANVQAYINLGAHIIGPNEAWVVVIDQRDPGGSGQTAPIAAALEAVADTFLCPDYNISYAMYFNGNDALSIQRFNGSTWDYIDIFGKMGDAAMVTSQGWSDAFPFDGSAGEIWTKDHGLVRKQAVMTGVTVNPATFIVTTEWDSIPEDVFSGLGTHTCNCPVGISEIDNKVEVNIYPNPSTNGIINLVAGEGIYNIEMIDVIGKTVLHQSGDKVANKTTVNTDGIKAGIYFVKVYFSDNRVSVIKVNIQ